MPTDAHFLFHHVTAHVATSIYTKCATPSKPGAFSQVTISFYFEFFLSKPGTRMYFSVVWEVYEPMKISDLDISTLYDTCV